MEASIRVLKCVYIELPGDDTSYKFLITSNPLDGDEHLHVSPVFNSVEFTPYIFDRKKVKKYKSGGLCSYEIEYICHVCSCNSETAQKILEALMQVEDIEK